MEEKFIFLVGNVSEGFTAFGPYEDVDDAFVAHEGDEGWLMTLNERTNNGDDD